jgi:hypothetical protein
MLIVKRSWELALPSTTVDGSLTGWVGDLKDDGEMVEANDEEVIEVVKEVDWLGWKKSAMLSFSFIIIGVNCKI